MASAFRSCCLASVLVALVGCGGGGGGGGGSSGAAGTLCDELVTCQQLPSSMRTLCVQSIDIYIPDPTAAKECIDARNVQCSDLSSTTSLNAIINGCLYDTSRFVCASATSLTIWSPATAGHEAVSKTLDCQAACSQVAPGTTGSCGFDGYPKCICH